MLREIILQACHDHTPQDVFNAAHDRIVFKDHTTLPSINLPDPDNLIEAFEIMNIALIQMQHPELYPQPHHTCTTQGVLS